jgi:transcriptional/translational regulatory protein YebC/TACO1
MFIGSREIKTVTPKEEDGKVDVLFDDGGVVTMNQNTLNLITIEEKGQGDVIDAIRYDFANKYVHDMAEHGLNFLEITAIAQGIPTLANQIKDQVVSMIFEAPHPQAIKMESIFNLIEKREEEEDLKGPPVDEVAPTE